MRALVFVILIVTLFVAGCATKPKTFVMTHDATWTTVEINKGTSYDTAWNTVIDRLVRDFDMEMLSKDDGYARTSWVYTWTGKTLENYRVRVIVKFNNDRKSASFKSEAELLRGGGWIAGYDTRLLSTLKTDIMGMIGRVTR